MSHVHYMRKGLKIADLEQVCPPHRDAPSPGGWKLYACPACGEEMSAKAGERDQLLVRCYRRPRGCPWELVLESLSQLLDARDAASQAAEPRRAILG
jgi:hypothetical protein